MKLIVQAMSVLPQNLVSYIVGWLTRLSFPKAIQIVINRGFVKLFGIDMSEAEKSVGDYRSIEDVFTRKLAEGKRPLLGRVVMPSDGTITISQAIENNELIQAKSLRYSPQELLFFGDLQPSEFQPAWQTTVYLAPHNYHRVHSPVDGNVVRQWHIPGRLWPVFPSFVESCPGLFLQNERLIFEIELASGGFVWVAMIGAFNVGRMVSALPANFVTHDSFRDSKPSCYQYPEPWAIQKGGELGTFMLGSTVILVFDQKSLSGLNLQRCQEPRTVQLGESLEES